MTQKQSKRYYNLNGKSASDRCNIIIKNDTDGGERSRRPILFSSENVERMAVESSRARLIMQLLSEPNESSEKTSQYCRNKSVVKSINNETITTPSRAAKFPASNRNFTTYPTLVQQCLRWSPSIETYSEDSQTDTSCEGRFKCKCHRCKMNKCLACRQKDTYQYTFKDNIVKFSDMSTMTRHVTDSGCGTCTSASTTDNSNVSIPPDFNINDVFRVQTSQTDTIIPTPILKTPDNKNNFDHILRKDMGYQGRADLGNTTTVCNDYDNLLKYYTKPLKNRSNFEDSGRVLFNEGTDGSITNNTLPDFSLSARRIKSQAKFNNCHRPHRTNKRLGKKTVIPYNHQTNSKYHYDCKESNNIYNAKNQEDLNYLAISPMMKPARHDTPSIRLPKRVLTSERNIEAFLDKRPTKMSSAFKY
ncbi:unnamed protein product [Euphydryas editha]|uniref:Uncharacterized protein n=1 Tax=Euphydryas editha TaxID=104508 RepID=A0AAU9VEC4_EUPED|nr:unnamed protein product [Euphydryas editha]